MRLSKEAILDYAKIVRDACGYMPTVFKNGTFEFSDLDKNKRDRILARLADAEFISDITDRKIDGNFEINGLLLENISSNNLCEDIEIHDTLNPKLWTEDNELDPAVREKISEIVDTFKNQLAEDNIKLDIDDIEIVGSNANFNYTERSDLDVHIIANQKSDCKDKHLSLIYDAYKRLFNNKYEITLNGVNVELYVENKDDRSVRTSGAYSLKHGWVKNPSNSEIPKINEAKLEKMVQEYEANYLAILRNPSIEAIESFIDKLYDIRVAAVSAKGEFALENLLFKELRNLGYLDNLKKLRDDLLSKQLSLL